jgi:hypothetical protein
MLVLLVCLVAAVVGWAAVRASDTHIHVNAGGKVGVSTACWIAGLVLGPFKSVLNKFREIPAARSVPTVTVEGLRINEAYISQIMRVFDPTGTTPVLFHVMALPCQC